MQGWLWPTDEGWLVPGTWFLGDGGFWFMAGKDNTTYTVNIEK
jgi:hypothetical protein